MVKIIVSDTMQHAWTAHPRLNPDFEPDEDDKFDLGNAAHSLILSDPKQFAVLDYADWRKAEAQKARDDARHAGKIPLLRKNWDRVNAMVAAARAQLWGTPDFAGVFENGKPEQTLIWEEDGVWMRARLDWLPDDHAAPYDDFKTSETADPDAWSRIMFSVRHDIQAAFYRRGIRALGLARQPRMRFVVQETSAPYCLSVFQPSPEVLELADREIERAIRRWRWCRAADSWPGYPAKVHTIEVPGWLETARMDRELRTEEIATREKVDPDLLAMSFKFQGPI